MATQSKRICRLIRMYQEENGVEEYLMTDVVQYAVDRGYKVPPPINGIEQLTKKFSSAAAEEMRVDEVTRKPYRAHHARWTPQDDGKQIPLWFDMDRVTRPTLQKYTFQRRQHMVAEAVQLSLSLDHWNRVHPGEEPVKIELDLTDDVEWRKNEPEDVRKAS